MRIKDICDINAFSISINDGFDNIQYLDTSNLTENEIGELQSMLLSEAPSRAQRRVKNNTILYSTVRPNQKHYGILSNPCHNLIVSTGYATLDIKESLKNEYDAHFLYYLLTQNWVTTYLQTLAENSVSSYPSINASDIGNLDFIFPKIEVQRQIAFVLKNIDDKIVLNRSINRNLELISKQLYDYWFVQFDFPDENGRPYKSSGGKMVWNELVKREIPAEWEVKTINDVAEVYNGATPSTADEQNYGGDVIWITPKDLSNQQQKFIYQGERNITKTGYNSCSTHLLPSDSILMSSRAPIGLLAIAKAELCTNQGFKSFVPKNTNYSTYLYYYLLTHIKQIEQLGTGTTFKEVSREDILKFLILKPTDDTLDFWETKIHAVNDKQLEIQKENENLTRQRDELLPLLMNGQVSVNSDLSLD